jgi:hypothetical protein
VFAVTLSIWFHNWSDSLHEHKEEREFLTGLQKDIRADLENAQRDSAFYAHQLASLQYFRRVGAGMPLNPDSGKLYSPVFFSNTMLEPNVSRYEGLKGSGKFGIIENKELLNDIIDLHERTIKHIESLDGYYSDYVTRMGTFVQGHGQLNEAGDSLINSQNLLHMSEMRFHLVYGISFITLNVLRYQDSCIVHCQKLIGQIDKELQ